MAVETWTALTSLAGVTLGGGLSYLVQRATQRTAVRIEENKQQLARAEARRAERLAALERFVAVAAEAESCAFTRPADWQEGDAWPTKTQEVMHRFWIAERMIRLVFPLPVHDAARAYFLLLNKAVWEGLPEGENLGELVVKPSLDFLDAARAALE